MVKLAAKTYTTMLFVCCYRVIGLAESFPATFPFFVLDIFSPPIPYISDIACLGCQT